MIRDARPDDIGRILELGERFFREAGWSRVAAWDAMSFVETVERLDGDGAMLVAEDGGRVVGMAGAAVYPAYFNSAVRMSQELFWYGDPAYRGREAFALFPALEAAVEAKGADVHLMGAVSGQREAALGRVYERHGYRPTERFYIKRIRPW
jgi:GNAT superfamily N-acetyltransferase